MPIDLSRILTEYQHLERGAAGSIDLNCPVAIILAGFDGEAEGIVKNFFSIRPDSRRTLSLISMAQPAGKEGEWAYLRIGANDADQQKSGELEEMLQVAEHGFLGFEAQRPFTLPANRKFHIAAVADEKFPATIDGILSGLEKTYGYAGCPYELHVDLYAFLSEAGADDDSSLTNARNLRLLETLQGGDSERARFINMAYIVSDLDSALRRSPHRKAGLLGVCLSVLLKDCANPGNPANSARAFDDRLFKQNATKNRRGSLYSLGAIALKDTKASTLAALHGLLSARLGDGFDESRHYSQIRIDSDAGAVRDACDLARKNAAGHAMSALLDTNGYREQSWGATKGDRLEAFFGGAVGYYADHMLTTASSQYLIDALRNFGDAYRRRVDALPGSGGGDGQPLGFRGAERVIDSYIGGDFRAMLDKAEQDKRDAETRIGIWKSEQFAMPKRAMIGGPLSARRIPDYPYTLAREYLNYRSECLKKELNVNLLRQAKEILEDAKRRCRSNSEDMQESANRVGAELRNALSAQPRLMSENFAPYYGDRIQGYLARHGQERAQAISRFMRCNADLTELYARLVEDAAKIAASLRQGKDTILEISERLAGANSGANTATVPLDRQISGGHVIFAKINGDDSALYWDSCLVAPDVPGLQHITRQNLYVDNAADDYYVLYYAGAFSMRAMHFGRRYSELLDGAENGEGFDDAEANG
jgi:hypothetical protein